MRAHGASLTLVLVASMALPSGTLADQGTVITAGVGLAFGDPELDDSGLRAVIERTHFVDQAPPVQCATVNQQRIVVLDLTEDCGHDVLREMPGYGTDPSINAGGTKFAWRIEAPGFHAIMGSTTDLSSGFQLAPQDAATFVDELQLSPDGADVFYWRRTGTTEELVRRPFDSVSPITALDSGTVIDLNDHHPVAADGTVYYSKLVGASREVHRALPAPGTTVEVVPGVGLGGDKVSVSVSADGSRMAFIHRSAGVANAFSMLLGSSPVALTTNTSASVLIDELDLSPDGQFVIFSSNGDFAGQNLDGSVEVFRTPAGGGGFVQVTDLPMPFPAQRPFIDGIAASANGSVVLVGRGVMTMAGSEPCLAADHHTARAHYYSLGTVAPGSTATTSLVMPPFDVKTVLAGLTLGCEPTGLSETTCRAVVRQSTEGPRRLLVMPRWSAPCGLERVGQPIPMTLAAEQQAVFEDVLATPPTCDGVQGTFSLVVISPDVAVADRAVATASFAFPP